VWPAIAEETPMASLRHLARLCILLAGTAAAQKSLTTRRDPDVNKTTAEIIREHGYPVEAHTVTTADGYILTAFRIPHGVSASQTVKRPPVLVQHALLCSSFDWVNNGPNQSLAFILADAGFDVWLGNNRGNIHGQNHTAFPVDSDAFWNFTWDEMALYDLPALVDYVLESTGESTLSYIGHSEGTIQAFAGFSRSQELSRKVNLFVALAPIAYIYHSSSPVFTALSKLHVPYLFQLLGVRQFLTSEYQLNRLAPWLCKYLSGICDIAIYAFCGRTRHINATRLPVYLSRTPAGTSVKNMIHWSQQLQRNAFRMYDYGNSKENQLHYGQNEPPDYKLSDVTVKTALFTGGHDILGDPTDEHRLSIELPTSSIVLQKSIPDYAHLDFAWAFDANAMVYRDVVSLLHKHTGSRFTSEDYFWAFV